MQTESSTTQRSVVLIVDDEALIRSALQRLLRQEPYEVLFAESAAQAQECLAGRAVDMVISDYRMPGVSGVELLTSVRQRYPATLRVLLTGSMGHDDIRAARQRGDIEAFLEKPWDNARLVEEMRRLLAEKRRA